MYLLTLEKLFSLEIVSSTIRESSYQEMKYSSSTINFAKLFVIFGSLLQDNGFQRWSYLQLTRIAEKCENLIVCIALAILRFVGRFGMKYLLLFELLLFAAFRKQTS